MMKRIGAGWLTLFTLSQAAGAEDIRLSLPVACEIGRTCFIQHYVDHDRSSGASDYQCGALTYDGHDGTDFRVPTMAAQKAGVDVLAAADGKVLRIRDGVEDISVAGPGRQSVAGTECGNGVVIGHANGCETQYCHMAKGSLAVKPGDAVKAGDRIGRIGLSGMTEFPHLHFTVRKDGKVVDPFKPGLPTQHPCQRSVDVPSLWAASLPRIHVYQAGTVLNSGFASGPVTMEAIESGEAERDVPNAQAPALVAFVRAIGLKGGDVQHLSLIGPDGQVLRENRTEPLDRDKAQYMLFVGLRRPASGWPAGHYRALYRVERNGQTAFEQAFGMRLGP